MIFGSGFATPCRMSRFSAEMGYEIMHMERDELTN
jgi:hypothetical protein